MKKIVIVGGGISGLTAGIYALKADFEAEIYEKNGIVGGECTGWDRRGYHIDNCIHWLVGTASGAPLNKIWRDTCALPDGIEILHPDRMYTSELGGQSVSLWSDAERTREELLALSPQDAGEIETLMANVKIAVNVEIPADKPPELMNPLDLLRLYGKSRGALKLFRAYKGMDTSDLMERFSHPLIGRMLSDFCPKESMAQSFAMAYGNFVSGDGGIPRGGSRALALRMGKRFAELGGRLSTRAEVANIDVRGNIASGITLVDGRRAGADYIVCTCDTDHTFGALLDRSMMDPVLSGMYSNPLAYPVYGMFQAAFAVDSEEDALRGDIMLDCGGVINEAWVTGRVSLKSYSYEPDFAPPGKQLIQALVGLSSDAYDYWKKLYESDKPAYDRKKAEIAGRLMKLIEARFPQYEGKLTVLDTWTPVTYSRYCNAYRGYNQAFTLTKRSAPYAYPSAYIKGLDNVLLAGQWLSPPGGLPGAAIQGKYAIQRILRLEKRRIEL